MAESAVSPQSSGPNVDTLFHLLLALAVIIATARLMGVCFMWIGQPPVIGEVVGGIMLGPSLLGRVAPGLYAELLPPALAPILGVYAQLGVILYMFLVGLELDLSTIRKSGHATIAISHASIIVPFLSGTRARPGALSRSWARRPFPLPCSRSFSACRCR